MATIVSPRCSSSSVSSTRSRPRPDPRPVTRALRRAGRPLRPTPPATPSALSRGERGSCWRSFHRATSPKAINYCLARWTRLGLFTEQATVTSRSISSIERQIRPPSSAFATGSSSVTPTPATNPAVIYSIIGTCKLVKIDHGPYLNWALPGLAAATNRHHPSGLHPQPSLLSDRSADWCIRPYSRPRRSPLGCTPIPPLSPSISAVEKRPDRTNHKSRAVASVPGEKPSSEQTIGNREQASTTAGNPDYSGFL